MITKQFATISTESYLPYTRMLYHSLMQSNPEAELTVFCDSDLYAELFGHNERLRFRVLPSIRKLGVLRAKLDVYLEMSDVPFTYLDSDIIVLEDLSCLFTGDLIAGCQVTLEECPFIENREYPWPEDPTLQNRRYCNAGVLFFPTTMRWFIETIRELAQDDECWRRYTIPGLNDNHFLCAMLNRFDVEFRRLDPHKFGIAGFRDVSNWNVTRLGDHLVNQPSGEILHLAHFAYAQDPDYCYARMPAWLAAFLQDRGSIRISRPAEIAAAETVAKAADPLVEPGAGAFDWEMAVLGMLGPFWVSGRYFVPVALVNHSNRDLGLSASIHLSYRWRRATAPNEIVVFEGERSEIHPDLRPGESRRILCEIRAPAAAGHYLIEFDLVEEGVTWFSAQGRVAPLREVDILSAAETRNRL
jgi:hypothetical protein